MKIRKATTRDSEELIKLVQSADNRDEETARRKVKKFENNQEGFFIIAVEKEKIVGYLLFIINANDESAAKFVDLNKYSIIAWIAVNPMSRELHVGSRLLNEAEKYAKKYHKEGLALDCREDVLGFYKKNNFIVVGDYPNPTKNGKIKLSYVLAKEIK